MKKSRLIVLIAIIVITLSSCRYGSNDDFPIDPVDTVHDLYLSVEETNHNLNDIVELHFESDARLYANKISFEITNDTASIHIEQVFIDNYAHYYVTASTAGQSTIQMLYDSNQVNNSEPVTLYFDYDMISTPEEFMAINNSTSAYKLANDIDFSGISYQTIESFSGSIDGQGYSLKNLYLETSNGDQHAIFGSLTETSSITNLSIDNFYLDAFDDYEDIAMLAVNNYGDLSLINYTGFIYAPTSISVGGLVTYNYGTINDIGGNIDIEALAYIGGLVSNNYGILNDITTHGEIRSNDVHFDSADPIAYIGGISAYSTHMISNATNHITIISKGIGSYVGGISGYQEINSSVTLENLKNYGDIEGESHVAGIFGYLAQVNGSYSEYTLNQIENYAQIISKNDYTGGIIGRHHSNNEKTAIITNLYNFQNVASLGSYAGGILGYSNALGTLINSENTAIIEGNQYVGGIIGYSKTLSIIHLINEGDIKGSQYVGGIIGYGSQISNAKNYGNINGVSQVVNQYIGGIAGLSQRTIFEVENYGNVSAYQQGNYIGGITGLFHPSMSNEIYNIINEGNVIGGNYIGGIFGDYVSNNNIYSNYIHALSNITNKGHITGIDYVGGISGRFLTKGQYNLGIYNFEKINFTSITNDGNITGQNYIGGIAGYMKYLKDTNYIVNEGIITGEGQDVDDIFGFLYD